LFLKTEKNLWRSSEFSWSQSGVRWKWINSRRQPPEMFTVRRRTDYFYGTICWWIVDRGTWIGFYFLKKMAVNCVGN